MAPVVEESVPKEEVKDPKAKEEMKEEAKVAVLKDENAEKLIGSNGENNEAPNDENVADQVVVNEEEEQKKKAVVEEEIKIATEIEPKTGVSFPTKLRDGKQLNSVGMRKKSILGLGVKIYAFGIYSDNEKLTELLRSKMMGAGPPKKPTKEMYDLAIDSDMGMMLRMVFVFAGLTMNMVKKNFDEGLGSSIKKLTGGRKDEDLTNKVMGAASDSIKLTTGSVIEITRLPGFTLQTKVHDDVVSSVESELLCRAFFHMYLGDDPFDKDAKERFGRSLMSLF